MAGFLIDLVTNKIILSVLAAFLMAGSLKLLFNYIAHDKVDWRVFFRTGGMPSSHTATVSAMTASVFFLEGVSNLFIICLIMASVIIADAVGIRRSAGKQAEVLNKVIEEFMFFHKFRPRRLHELLGHTPKQAIAGIVLGILTARIVFLV